MKILAVREENVMVARVTLHNMKQDRGEPICAFGARLRGQAGVCKFTQQCTNCQANVDYTETILRDVLCRGLEDSEIQLELLGYKNQDMTLEQILRFVEAKEAGKRSAHGYSCHMQPMPSPAAHISGKRGMLQRGHHQRIRTLSRIAGRGVMAKMPPLD